MQIAGHKLSLLQLAVLMTALIGLGWQAGALHAQQPTPPAPPADSQATEGVAKQPPAAPAESRAPDPATKAAPGEGIPALVVDVEQMQGVLGKPVRSAAGEDMGRIVDVIIDKSARVRAAVIDFGGFLGVGSRQIAIAWNALRVSGQGKASGMVVDFTRDQLRVAPAYKAGEQVVVLGPSDAPPATNPANPPAANPTPPQAAPTNGTPAKDAPKEQPSK